MTVLKFNIENQGQVKRAVKRYGEVIGEDISRVATSETERKVVKRLVQNVERAGYYEGNRLFPYIAKNLVGYPIYPGEPIKVTISGYGPEAKVFSRGGEKYSSQAESFDFKELDWVPLSERYAQWKARRTSRNKWFKYSGALQRQLYGMDASDIFGKPVVTFKKDRNTKETKIEGKARERKMVVGTIRAKVFPRLNSSNLPYLRSGNIYDVYTRTAFGGMIPEDVRRKTQGNNVTSGSRIYRPLLQPVINFWIANKIPGAMAKAMLRRQGPETYRAGD